MLGNRGEQMDLFRKFDAQGFVVLDGGMGTELERRGCDINHPLWSSKLLVEDPDAIRQAHLDFLLAGADCIISTNYQASIPGFLNEGFSSAEAEDLMVKAITVALDARKDFIPRNEDPSRVPPLVAASIGPYGAFLADGSEYRGDYGIGAEELRAFHEPRWQILQGAGADFFAFETIPSFDEAMILKDLLLGNPKAQAFMSFSCMDGERISDGTPIAECARVFSDCGQIIAIGANCTAPKYMSSLIECTRQAAPDKPVVVYPNSGEIYDGEASTWHGATATAGISKSAPLWLARGARLIGGCCRTTPSEITEIRKALLR